MPTKNRLKELESGNLYSKNRPPLPPNTKQKQLPVRFLRYLWQGT